MQTRKIPNTDLEVSVVCVGTMLFGTPVNERGATAIVSEAFNGGVNFFDTANMYEGYTRFVGSTGGLSEEYLGKAIVSCRHKSVIATKVGMAIGPNAKDRGLSRDHVKRECDRSLIRLQTDYTDIYYLHSYDELTPIEWSIETMIDLIAAGKVRFWGISNFNCEQTMAVLAACDRNGWTRPVVHQPQYSLVNRCIEEDLVPLCRKEEISIVPYRIIESGLLCGKYDEGIPKGSRADDNPSWIPQLENKETIQEVAVLNSAARDAGRTLYEHVLLETANKPGIASILLGIKRPEQIKDACQILN